MIFPFKGLSGRFEADDLLNLIIDNMGQLLFSFLVHRELKPICFFKKRIFFGKGRACRGRIAPSFKQLCTNIAGGFEHSAMF